MSTSKVINEVGTSAKAESPANMTLHIETSQIDSDVRAGSNVDVTMDDVATSPLPTPTTEPVFIEKTHDAHEPKLVSDSSQAESYEDDDEDKTWLWDKAYDLLREEHFGLIDQYERTIKEYLKQDGELDVGTPRISNADISARRAQMTKALEIWLHKDLEGEAEGGTDQKDTTKAIIRDLIQRSPHAPLVWLATCLSIAVCKSIFTFKFNNRPSL
jgi:hypothetical protein